MAVGGAVGAVLRLAMVHGLHTLLGSGFPYGILAVNVLGSFIIGCLSIALIDRVAENELWRLIFFVGLLGGFTTFSTFSLDTIELMMGGWYSEAIWNVVLSVSLCLGGTFFGITLMRWLS